MVSLRNKSVGCHTWPKRETMFLIVCIKQVPDTTEVKMDPDTGTLIREGIPSVINPSDVNAVEEGLRLKDLHGAKVAVMTMGPPQAEEALRDVLAMGADRAILLTCLLYTSDAADE